VGFVATVADACVCVSEVPDRNMRRLLPLMLSVVMAALRVISIRTSSSFSRRPPCELVMRGLVALHAQRESRAVAELATPSRAARRIERIENKASTRNLVFLLTRGSAAMASSYERLNGAGLRRPATRKQRRW
jgi:hypothetical protein